MQNLTQMTSLIQWIFGLVFVLGIVVLVLVGLGLLLLRWFKYRNREEVSMNFVVLEIQVPRDNEVKIDAAEQMFSALYSIKKGGFWQKFKAQQHMSFEIVAKKEEIRFYVACDKELASLIDKQFSAIYSGAQVKQVEEPNIFGREGKVEFAQLKLSNKSFYPIKTFQDLPADPLSSITSSMAELGEEEAAAVQIVVTPAESDWSKSGNKFLSEKKKAEADPEKAEFKLSPEDMKAIDEKTNRSGFLTTIRLVSVAENSQRAKGNLKNIQRAFAQFSSDQNRFSKRKIWFKRVFMVDFIYRYQSLFGENSLLNTAELASVWHMPNKTVETPHIKWLPAKMAPATGGIPNEGLYLGKSIYRGQERKIYLSDEDRMKHTYVLGRTGTGKTEFLKSLILQDMREGKGLCFLEPHGEGIEELLELVPPERAEDVIVFDPSDTERPMGFNLLEVNNPEEMHFVASSVINLMYKLYDPHKT